MSTGVFMQASVNVYPILMGDFIITTPPNVMTPNGDGLNDVWEVRGRYSSNTPINAYGWDFSVHSRWGNEVYHSSFTDTNSGPGVIGGQLTWDGTGAPSDGTYYYSFTLYNCSQSQTYSGTIDIYGSNPIAAPPVESIAIYPNPATEQLTVNPRQVLHGDASARKAGAKSEVVTGQYELKLVDRFNRVQRSVTSKEAQAKLDVSTLPEGIYFLQVTQGKETTRKQIVVKH